ALEEDGHGRLAARGGTEQQQQPAPDVGAGGRGLEIIDHARQRLVDSKQLALEELARAGALRGIGLRGASMPAEHVPDVLVARACHRRGARGQDVGEKLAEGAFPALGPMQFAEGAQRLDEGGSARRFRVSRKRSHRPSLPFQFVALLRMDREANDASARTPNPDSTLCTVRGGARFPGPATFKTVMTADRSTASVSQPP